MRHGYDRPERGTFEHDDASRQARRMARHLARMTGRFGNGDALAGDGPGFGGGFGGGPFGGGFGGGPFGGGRGGRLGGGHGRGHGGGHGDGHGGGPAGRRGGRGRMFAGGELRLLLLSLVAEQDRHGYELIKAVEELTGGQYAPSPGVVYPTLALLVDEGMIAEAAGEGARKAFTIAEAGRTELAGRGEELSVIVDRLTSLAKAGAQAESPPVRRAFANLGLALRQRVEQDGFDEETAHRIADILDEAARQIERLPKQA